MACGVPVLCTTSTGGADFIRHRRNGLLIEPGSVAAIEQELAWALTHRDELFQLRPGRPRRGREAYLGGIPP
jgi:glycosyltransferase involved in cell wall biosynthesis